MRSAWLSLVALAALSPPAAAQINAVPGINDSASSFPMFGIPLQEADKDNYRRLPFRELTGSIHIEASADLFYDFQSRQVRASGSDLLQQAANLIYDRTRSPVRIECRSDRTPPAAA